MGGGWPEDPRHVERGTAKVLSSGTLYSRKTVRSSCWAAEVAGVRLAGVAREHGSIAIPGNLMRNQTTTRS
jgi:hypothetical protein